MENYTGYYEKRFSGWSDKSETETGDRSKKSTQQSNPPLSFDNCHVAHISIRFSPSYYLEFKQFCSYILYLSLIFGSISSLSLAFVRPATNIFLIIFCIYNLLKPPKGEIICNRVKHVKYKHIVKLISE